MWWSKQEKATETSRTQTHRATPPRQQKVLHSLWSQKDFVEIDAWKRPLNNTNLKANWEDMTYMPEHGGQRHIYLYPFPLSFPFLLFWTSFAEKRKKKCSYQIVNLAFEFDGLEIFTWKTQQNHFKFLASLGPFTCSLQILGLYCCHIFCCPSTILQVSSRFHASTTVDPNVPE